MDGAEAMTVKGRRSGGGYSTPPTWCCREAATRISNCPTSPQKRASHGPPSIAISGVSLQGLLDAFSVYEQDNFDAGIAAAVAGPRGADRLDAALRFIVDFQDLHSARSVVDIEPDHVLDHMRRSLPVIRDRSRQVITGSTPTSRHRRRSDRGLPPTPAGGTPEEFLAELRPAAGLRPRRGGSPRSVASLGRKRCF